MQQTYRAELFLGDFCRLKKIAGREGAARGCGFGLFGQAPLRGAEKGVNLILT
jgi:hypothetical protein